MPSFRFLRRTALGAALLVLGTAVRAQIVISGTTTANSDAELGTSGHSVTFSGGTLQTSAVWSTSRAATLDSTGGTIFVDSSGDLTWSGAISGTGALTKTGSGTLTLSGANTYSGVTTISAGTLRAGAANALSSASTFFVINGATLDLNGFNQTVKDLDSYDASTGAFDAGAVILGGATLTNLNSVTNNWSGSIQGSGTFIKQGAAEMKWSAANTFTGTLQIDAGSLVAQAANVLSPNAAAAVASGATLNLNNFSQTAAGLSGAGSVALGSGTLTLNQAGNTTFSGVIDGTGSLVKSGAGTLTLSGANTYSGGTTISVGTLRLGADNTLPTGGAVTVASGASFDLGGFAQTVGSLGGTGAVAIGSSTLTLGNAVTASGTAFTVDGGKLVVGAHTLVGNFHVPTTATIQPGTSMHFTIDASTTGGGILTKLGAGELKVAGNSLAGLGELAVGVGTVSITSETATLPKLTLATGTSLNTGIPTITIRGLAGSGAVDAGGTLAEALEVPPPEDAESPPFDPTIYTPNYLVVQQDSDSTFSGTIIGMHRLAKEGTGTLTLTGNNSFYEGVALRGGTLAVPADNALGYAGFADAILLPVGNRVVFEGGTLRALDSFSTSRLAVFSGNGAIEVDAGKSLTWHGAFSGSGTLDKTGAGALTFDGSVANGALNVQAGTTVLTTGNQLATLSQVTIASGATLEAVNLAQSLKQLNGAGTLTLGTGALTITNGGTFSGALNTTGGLALIGGTLALSGAKTYSGGTSVTGSVLQLDTDAALGSGALTVDGGTLKYGAAFNDLRAFTLGSNGATFDTNGFGVSYSHALSGSGSLTKNGNGTLTLMGNSNYSGGTTINAGTLALGHANGVGTSSTVAVGAGAIFDTGTHGFNLARLAGAGAAIGSGAFSYAAAGDHTLALVLGGTASLAKSGAGTLTLSGANTFAAGTVLTAGTLTAGHASAFGSGTVRIDAGTLDLAGLAVANALDVRGGALTGLASYTGTQTVRTGMSYSGAVGGALLVASSGNVNTTGATFTGTATIESGGLLTGTGTIGGLTVASGGTLSPGNFAGVMVDTGNATWNSGGVYEWQINHATGAAGTAWDLLSISGTLTIASTSGSPFTLSLASLTSGNAAGLLAGFNPAQNYSYTIASATGGILNFNTSKFTLDTSGFQNALNGGTWSLALGDGDRNLDLNFTASAIPEPSTYAAIAGAVMLGLAAWRRRKREERRTSNAQH